MAQKLELLTSQILIASDHAGYKLKEYIKTKLKVKKLKIRDLGTNNKKKSVDYPIYARKLSQKINRKNFGILVCGSGIGMSITSNRSKNVRSALVNSVKISKISRKHNNANVICIGSRFISKQKAIKCILTFLTTKFDGGRHLKRVKLLS